MSAALFYSSIGTSTATYSKTHFPVPINFCMNRSFGGRRKKSSDSVQAAVAESLEPSQAAKIGSAGDGIRRSLPEKSIRVLIAGGGIGGLVFALAAKKKGFDVMVLEKDLSAIRGEGQYRGPIQIQSNALAALEAIDMDVAEQIMGAGCVTGDRINGLVDGVSGNWYIKFDTFSPAVERGLPVTRVISRMTLQQILAQAVGEELIVNESNVVCFKDDGNKVTVFLENGESYEGDLLVGADGIRSKVRKTLFGSDEPVYSGYTCYSGIADYVPADIETVGYRVFLGHKQYFVSSDVGQGKMQWYAFYKEPPCGVDGRSGKKQRLLEIFAGWCDNVVDLILATEEDAILRRDIYDRRPSFTWGRGRVTLLGDSIHAMQPNMGQGGCMAIEDGYQLALELDKAWQKSPETGKPIDIVSSLKSYERARKLRVAAIHCMARMAAMMASTYKAYLGVGLGPLSFLAKFRIPHPGRVGGRVLISRAMPLMLSWVLGGNSEKLEGRVPSCRLSDKASDHLERWFKDDDAMERALSGDWVFVPRGDGAESLPTICLSRDEDKSCLIGKVRHENLPGISVALPCSQVSERHAQVSCKDGAFFVTDLGSEHGTWISDNEGRRHRLPPNMATRIHPSYVVEFGTDNKAIFRVKVMKTVTKMEESNVATLQNIL